MKRTLLSTMALLLIGALAVPALAQDRPRPPRDGGGPGGGFGGPGGPPDGPGGPGGPGGPDGPGMGMMGGPGGPPDGMGPGMGMGMGGMRRPPEAQKLEMLRNYVDVVDRFARLSRDPTAAGVAAVIAASDMLRQRGTDAAIEYFNKALGEVKSEAVQRAIRIQLIDLYKASGQQDKALEQLDTLMKGAPAGAPAAAPSAGSSEGR